MDERRDRRDDDWGWGAPAGDGRRREQPVVSDPERPPASPPGEAGDRGAPRRSRLRRRSTAGAALLAMLLGFFVAGLLDARALESDARSLPLGTQRSVALTLLKPMTALSGALRLDRPSQQFDALLGRDAPHHTLAQARPAKPLWPRLITAKRPLKVYIAGDSMAATFGSSLANLAAETGLVKTQLDYHISSGLSRPDYFDWPQRLIDMLVEYRPDAAVMLFGANDGQDVLYKGKVLKVGTRAWKEVYQRRVGMAMEILTKSGRRVYWVGNPIMRDEGYRARIAMMDHIYAAEAKRHRGVTYVSTWQALADEKGSYAEYLRTGSGDLVQMRAPDGIHLTRAGGDRMAQVVLDAIMRDWDIAAPR